jgi:lipopolysaccharide export system permease protein
MIRRLDRHVLGWFLTAFGLVTLACLMLYTVFDFSMRAAAFVREGFPAWRVAQFYLYFVPRVFAMLAPVIVILAVAWSVGQLTRDNEITAMRACGVAPARIAAPLFVVCALLACAMFVLNERVVTQTYAYIDDESELLRRKPPKETLQRQYFYTDDEGGNLFFQEYDVKRKVMKEVSWGRPATPLSPRLQIFADRAEWLGGRWWLFGVQVTRIDRQGNEVHSPRCAKMIMYEWELPPDYISGEKDPPAYTLGELNRRIRWDRQTQPQIALEYRLERHYRFALPVLAVLVVLLSFPLVVNMRTRRGGAAAALGVSVLLCLAYYGLYISIVALARKAAFPPMLWIPNLAYGAAGTFMFLKMR